MASGHVCRAQRPNTWLLRPMLQTRRKPLPTRSRPHMAHLRPLGMSARGSAKVQTPGPKAASVLSDAFGAAQPMTKQKYGDRLVQLIESEGRTKEARRHTEEEFMKLARALAL